MVSVEMAQGRVRRKGEARPSVGDDREVAGEENGENRGKDMCVTVPGYRRLHDPLQRHGSSIEKVLETKSCKGQARGARHMSKRVNLSSGQHNRTTKKLCCCFLSPREQLPYPHSPL